MNVNKYCWLLLILLLFSTSTQAQLGDRFEDLGEELEQFSKDEKNLNKKIDISALGSVSEIVSAIAQQTKINITIDPSIKEPLVSNFSKVSVQDLLLYLCRQFELDLSFSGSIITISRYQAPKSQPTIKEIGVRFNPYNSFLSMDLNKDTLGGVVRKITQQSGQNVIVSKKAKNLQVSAYVDKASVEDALNLLATANDLNISKTKEGAFFIRTKEEIPEEELTLDKRKKLGKGINYEAIEGLEIKTVLDSVSGELLVSVEALKVPFIKIIKGVSIEMGRDYFLFKDGGATTITTGTRPNRNNNNNSRGQNPMSLKIENATYDEFLNYILQGTDLTYKIDNDIYLIGDRSMEGLRETKVIQLQYRSAFELEKVIPKDIATKVNIHPFLELNSIILSGSAPNIAEVEDFIKGIDKLVPVVNIELIILDVNRNVLMETGIDMGVGSAPITNEQMGISPGLNFTLGANSINKLLNALTGQSIVNLGNVVPNFYLSLKAVEEAGIAKTRSKPQLATLNSHEASFNIGEKRYYRIVQNTVTPGVNPIVNESVKYEPLEANFNIKITPYISGDEQITLDIAVEQSDFLGEAQPDAPPASVSRKFESKIRVKNNDMIVLGGLETKRKDKSTRGLPFMARIPVLNWFGNRKSTKSKSELLIFVKPTIVY